MSSFDYINFFYGLSLKCGSRVEYTGGDQPWQGTVTSADGAYIYIRFDGADEPTGPFHPVWELRQLHEAKQ